MANSYVWEMIQTIIFDLGGVLIDWNPRYLYRTIFDTEAEIEDFLANVATMDWNEQQDGGRSMAEGTAILVSKFPNYQAQIEAFYSRWTEMLGGAIEGTVDILKELKANDNYRLLALTNWSAETFPFAQERYEFLTWFEGILVSGEEKVKKPDPKIYKLMLEKYEVDPTTAIFIDDNLRNVKAAEACGIQSIHFVSPDQLVDVLSNKGLL